MADVGTGTKIVFGTSAFSAELTGIAGSDISREVVDTSHMGTTVYRTFMPSDLADPGTTEMEIAFNPNSQPPITAAAETITITFPVPSGDSSGATFAGSGFVSNWSWGDPLEDKMTASISIKWTGTPTWTDST